MDVPVLELRPVRNAVLSFEMAGTLMLPEEFDAVEEYDEQYRYELIHGVLVVNPIPLAEETDPNEELGRWLRNYKEQHSQGSILDATMPQQYIYTANSRRLADRVLWIGLGRRPDRRMDVPAVAVEFVSAGKRNRTRDYEEKKTEYLAAGVREYWIIDRFQRQLTVWRNTPQGPETQVVPDNQVYLPALLPGFELPLAPLLAIADRWAEGK